MDEMALSIKALFYFNCVRHKEFKNKAFNRLWERFAVWDGMGLIIPLRLL